MQHNEERKKQRFYKLAICALILIVPLIWTATGRIAKFSKVEISQPKANEKKQKFYKIESSESFTTFANITLYGSSYPFQEVDILSELDGKIAEILVNDGDEVQEGEVIAQLDERQYKVMLEQANAQYEKEGINFLASKKLYKKKLSSFSSLAEAKAKYSNAKAALEIAKNNFNNISITAPFTGKVERIYVEQGEVVSKYKSKIANLLDNEIIIVRAYIPENRIMDVYLNSKVDVTFTAGIKKPGVITYIADKADNETRTYLMEAELENLDKNIKVGMTAKVKIPTKKIKVHNISSSALALGESGKVGVKYVDTDNIVQFAQIKIEDEQQGKILVSGLPDKISMITSGHGFLATGRKLEN